MEPEKLHLLRIAIKDIFIHEYREVKEIWDLIPEERWISYELMEMTGLREQFLLESALLNLRHSFEREVLIYVKKKKSTKETDTEDTTGIENCESST